MLHMHLALGDIDLKRAKSILFFLSLYITLFLTAQLFDFMVISWPLKDDIALWEEDLVYVYEAIGWGGVGEELVLDVIEVGVSEKYIIGNSEKGFFYIDLDKIKEATIFRKLAHSSTDRSDLKENFNKYEMALSEGFKIGISEKEFQSFVQQYDIKLKTPWTIELLNIIWKFKFWFLGEIIIFLGISMLFGKLKAGKSKVPWGVN